MIHAGVGYILKAIHAGFGWVWLARLVSSIPVHIVQQLLLVLFRSIPGLPFGAPMHLYSTIGLYSHLVLSWMEGLVLFSAAVQRTIVATGMLLSIGYSSCVHLGV